MPSRHKAHIKQKRTTNRWFFPLKAQLSRAFDTSVRKKFRLPELFPLQPCPRAARHDCSFEAVRFKRLQLK